MQRFCFLIFLIRTCFYAVRAYEEKTFESKGISRRDPLNYAWRPYYLIQDDYLFCRL